MNSNIHEYISSYFSSVFIESDLLYKYLWGGRNTTLTDIFKEPDNQWGPLTVKSPTIVLEVGISQSLTQLRKDVEEYFKPNSQIQIVILVKVWDRSIPPKDITPTFPIPAGKVKDMLIEVYYKNNSPGKSIYFGNYGNWTDRAPPKCTKYNLPEFQIELPGELMFFGSPIFEQVKSKNITFDLYGLQKCILNN